MEIFFEHPWWTTAWLGMILIMVAAVAEGRN
jgi:hypothetical protein